MNCLCCGRQLHTEFDLVNGWHKRCIKDFFSTNEFPDISLDESVIEELANKSVNQGLTVPGVQKKLSLHLDKEGQKARFTLVGYPTGYILKPQSQEYQQLPEAEHLVMTMARTVGIATVPFGLLKIGSNYAYITKRVDRLNHAKYAMEDFCQLAGRPTADKYKGSYEECGRIIRKYSARVGLDVSEFFFRLVFCDVVGNSDMHLKNFSLIESEPRSRRFILSPAYDLLPVNVVLPSDQDFSALTLNGKKRNLRRNDFMALAENLKINEKAAKNIINKVIGDRDKMMSCIQTSLVPDEFKKDMIQLMDERMELLG